MFPAGCRCATERFVSLEASVGWKSSSWFEWHSVSRLAGRVDKLLLKRAEELIAGMSLDCLLGRTMEIMARTSSSVTNSYCLDWSFLHKHSILWAVLKIGWLTVGKRVSTSKMNCVRRGLFIPLGTLLTVANGLSKLTDSIRPCDSRLESESLSRYSAVSGCERANQREVTQ